MAGPEPGERSIKVGPVTIGVKGRIATLTGLPAHPRLAAFSGPGFGPAPSPGGLSAVRKSAPDLIFVLGGLGETEAEVAATGAALANLERPVFVLPGGRDRWSNLSSAFGGSARIIDVTAVRELRIGKHTFVLVPGADSGRYSIDSGACGFGATDLEQLAKALGSAKSGPRWLVSWHAPAAAPGQAGITRTESGVDTGSWNLSRFASQVGVQGGFYAWPVTQAGRSTASPTQPTQLLVPRLWGPREERDDGSLAPLGFALLTVGDTSLEAVR